MDPRQAEVLTQFAKLLEVLSDPASMKALVEDTKKATQEYNKTLGMVKTKEEADGYLAKAKDALGKSAELIDDDWNAHEAKKKAEMEYVNKTKEESYLLSKNASKLMEEAKQKEAEANSMEKSAKKMLEDAFAQTEANRKLAAELAKQESELKDKADKLKQLMGV